MTWRAAVLEPMERMAPAGGPIQIRPAAFTASANPVFSARKPYPGCTAWAPVRALDSVFVRGAVELRSLQRPRTRGARTASDHIPLVADLAVHPHHQDQPVAANGR